MKRLPSWSTFTGHNLLQQQSKEQIHTEVLSLEGNRGVLAKVLTTASLPIHFATKTTNSLFI